MSKSDFHKHRYKKHSKHVSSRSRSPGRSDDEHVSKNYENFSFLMYRSDFSKIFDRFPYIIEDVDDFWLFVKKYETVQQQKSDHRSREDAYSGNYTTNRLGLPTEHDASHSVNIDINIPEIELLTYVVNTQLKKRIAQFRLMLSFYVDFKQKEKFATLRKIRSAQQNLPVTQYKSEIVNAVSKERVVIIAGDTGCGKSTQIPQYLMEAGYTCIACTQPRRIACISLSKRVAKETLSEYQSNVGYQIRFEKNRNLDTRILFITEGLLLRQVNSGDMLSGYDVIILDEVHERHLQGDFLLGIAKCLLHQRQDFKLILMSATINIQLFKNYFGDMAKVIQVPGRLYPIKLQYRPVMDTERSDRFDPAPYIKILQLIDHKYSREERGDVLIFLNGVKGITTVVDAAKAYNEKVNRWCILPLHSSLSLADQDKVFDYPPEGYRKCVVSTNIAETSVTIDGIRFVIDSGKVNEISYDPVCKMQRLKEFWISRASAEQRKGRAGRTGPGICFRLYSEEDYASMSQYTTPEIQRVPLDSVLLQMIAMGLPDARKFPFIEPPAPSSIENAISTLKQYNALTSDEKLTEIGKMLSELPVDIPLGKMLIMGTLFDQAESVLSLAATLSVQSPYTNKAFRDSKMLELRKDLESDHGDILTLLSIYREWLDLKTSSSSRGSNSTRRWCKGRGLEEQRFYEMTKLRSQFKDLLIESELINIDSSAVKSTEEMTSAERTIRHGELKQLKRLKREADKEAPRKPKILKLDKTWEVADIADNEDDTTTDMQDVDFRLRHNPREVQDLLKSSTANSYKDVTMLKVILCSALYPQIAIPDELNMAKTIRDRLFHTAEKPYIALHPTSYFANNPEILDLDNCDIMQPLSDFQTKLPISSRHQVLFYMSLLETTKPYLMNMVRMPAAQSLLLFCNQLHTNHNFSRIICDSWLELRFPLSHAAEKLLLKVIKIRIMWNKLLSLRLQGQPCGKMDQELEEEILKYLRMEIYYTLKRMLPADLKTIYKNVSDVSITSVSINPFDPEYEMKLDKLGGLRCTESLVYDCLTEDSVTYETWQCNVCDLTVSTSSIERLQHQYSHSSAPNSGNVETKSAESQNMAKKPHSRLYHCDTCDKDYCFTTTEILRHKKQHALES